MFMLKLWWLLTLAATRPWWERTCPDARGHGGPHAPVHLSTYAQRTMLRCRWCGRQGSVGHRRLLFLQ